MNRALRAISTGMLIVAQLVLDQKLWGANEHHSTHRACCVHTSMMMAESEASPLLLPLPPLPVPPSLAELHSHQRMWLKKKKGTVRQASKQTRPNQASDTRVYRSICRCYRYHHRCCWLHKCYFFSWGLIDACVLLSNVFLNLYTLSSWICWEWSVWGDRANGKNEQKTLITFFSKLGFWCTRKVDSTIQTRLTITFHPSRVTWQWIHHWKALNRLYAFLVLL